MRICFAGPDAVGLLGLEGSRTSSLELRGRGAEFANLFRSEGVRLYVVALVASAAMYTVLAMYLDQVVPQGYGATRWGDVLPDTRVSETGSSQERASLLAERDPAKFETEPAGRGAPLVELHAVARDFRGLKAVDDVSMQLYEGEIFALIGHNGAGKSTLLNM
ncbi:hypothetical protein HK405_006112 [Cladochytrium tenue]|nr:hypothetical protein HK405_006112 [Cladochytrium tenue]